MRSRNHVRRIRFPALPEGDNAQEPVALVLDDEEDAACSEYVVMSHEPDLPALQEHLHDLHELDSRTIH